MFYVSKMDDNRIRVVMYGRVVFMNNEEFTRWKNTVLFH